MDEEILVIERRVTGSGKDRQGDITSLCGAWGRRGKDMAIQQIERSTQSYYVEEERPRVYVDVVTLAGRKHLRTTADSNSANNLDNLPNC